MAVSLATAAAPVGQPLGVKGESDAAMRANPAEIGWLEFGAREAHFLRLVLEHAGVCLPRQYRAFAGVAHGRHSQAFFDTLIAGGFATTDLAAPAHAGRIYHVQYEPWYRTIGARDHPHRRTR